MRGTNRSKQHRDHFKPLRGAVRGLPPSPCPEELPEGHMGFPTPLFGASAPEVGCQSWLARGIQRGLTPREPGAVQ